MMTLFTLLLIVPLVSGGFVLTCSTLKEEEEGEDATLWFKLDSVNLTKETVDVMKTNHSQIVHLYRNGKDQPDAQLKQYRHRTTLDHKDLSSGNIRLKISSVMKSDSGCYTCNIPRLKLNCSMTLDVVEKKNHHSAAPPLKNNSTSGKVSVGAMVGAVVTLCVFIPVVALIVVRATSGRIKNYLKRCRGQRDKDADPMELDQVVTERETDSEREREREDLLNHHSPLDTNEQEH